MIAVYTALVIWRDVCVRGLICDAFEKNGVAVNRTRCSWANGSELEMAYHDAEWGVPLHDDQKLFEFICLEGAQAGLSWSTILKKRVGYHELFHNFSIEKCAAMTDEELEEILQNPKVVRNRLKVYSVRKNATAAQKIVAECGSLDSYLWSFVNNVPIDGERKTMADVPATTAVSNRMSVSLKKAGFTFVGSTICYAFMQAIGMVNDHTIDCFRHGEITANVR